jgi:hypothetical protein
MTTESDRDDLARIIFTVTKDAHWQEWEQTSEGIRAWCRAKADEAMATGWRRVGDVSSQMARAADDVLDQDGYAVAYFIHDDQSVTFTVDRWDATEEGWEAETLIVQPDGTSLSSDSDTCLRLTDMCRAVAAALAHPAGANGGG